MRRGVESCALVYPVGVGSHSPRGRHHVICTVSTIKDSITNVQNFVGRNLAAGADHLFVFSEGGDREVLAFLDDHAHVTVVDADELNRRIPQASGLNARQTINANRINVLLADVDSAEWLFHIDGDEVLDIDRDRLLALGPDVDSVRLVPRESVSASQPEHEGYFKRLLEQEELALLTVLGVLEEPSNRTYFQGHVAGKVGIRPSVRHGLHIHQSRVLGEENTQKSYRADWLRVLHYESVTLKEFLRKWEVHIQAGPETRFRGEKELIRGAIIAVLGNTHLDEDEKRQHLAEIYRLRVEDDVPTLLGLGLLETVEPLGHRPGSFTREEAERMARELSALLEAEQGYFQPRRLEHDPAELRATPHRSRSLLGGGWRRSS